MEAAILRIDLARKDTRIEQMTDAAIRKYIDGRGLGSMSVRKMEHILAAHIRTQNTRTAK